MDKKIIEKLESLMADFPNIDIVIKENKIEIVEKAPNIPDLEKFLKIYVSDDKIKKTGNGYIIDTSNVMSGNKMRVLLRSLFIDEYNIDVPEPYKVVLTKKNKNEKFKYNINNLEDLAYKLDEKFKNADIIVEEDSLEIIYFNPDEILEYLDTKNYDIEIYENRLIIKEGV